MPKYITVTPTFNPISYAERIAPLKDYTEQYNKFYDELSSTGTLADAVGGLIDSSSEEDAALYNKYRTFNADLNSAVDNMMSVGNLNTARKSLHELKGRYANELVPIQKAFESRAERIKEYDKALAADPSYIGYNPRGYGLTSFMNGNSPADFYASGDKISSDAKAQAAALSNRMSYAGTKKGYRVIIGGMPEDMARRVLNAAMTNDNTGLTESEIKSAENLKDIFNNTYQKYGLSRFGRDDEQIQSQQAIWDGIYQGLIASYKETPIPITNVNVNSGGSRGVLNGPLGPFAKMANTTSMMYANNSTINKSINKYFDSNGVFKDNWFDPEDFGLARLRNSGKLRNPLDEKTGKLPDWAFEGKAPMGTIQEDIINILTSAGFTTSQIRQMGKNEIKSAFEKIYKQQNIDATVQTVAMNKIDNSTGTQLMALTSGELQGYNEDGSPKINKNYKFGKNEEITGYQIHTDISHGEPHVYLMVETVSSKHKTPNYHYLEIKQDLFGGNNTISNLVAASSQMSEFNRLYGDRYKKLQSKNNRTPEEDDELSKLQSYYNDIMLWTNQSIDRGLTNASINNYNTASYQSSLLPD